MQYNYAATCLFGLEGMVGSELDSLGVSRTNTIDGRVYFTGSAADAARVNINSRFAERIYLVLGSFHAGSFDELFEGTKKLPWAGLIGRDDAFPVNGHSIRSALSSIPDCQSIVKKAIVERLKLSYGLERYPETGTVYKVEFFILNDRADLMIDLSGSPLHKRGYRSEGAGVAPLRETLAAAIVSLSRPRENVVTWDPFCGSGTIAIEAAMMMTNTAPGMNRSFSAQSFPVFPAKIWDDARDEALSLIKDSGFTAYASDIDPAMVRLAKDNVRRAGMTGHVRVFEKDALKLDGSGIRGTIVCNPPYGERLWTEEEAKKLYAGMGKTFSALDRWQFYILTSCPDFERCFGRKADKVRPMNNGMIKCGLYMYYKGSDKSDHTKHK